MAAIRKDLLKDVSPFFGKPLLSILEETSEDLISHFIDTDSQLQLYNIGHVYFNRKSLLSAILGEKVRRLLQDKALRNDCLRNLVLSLRAKRSNLKGFQFHRELLVSCYFRWVLYQAGLMFYNR